MKKVSAIFVLLVCIILFGTMAACAADTPAPSSMAAPEEDYDFYDESTGKVYTDKSENFDFKMEHWKYFHSSDMDVDEIFFDILIKNKTGKDIKNFVCNISFDGRAQAIIPDDAKGYIAIGFLPNDLASNINGQGYAFEVPVVDRDTLKNMPDSEQLLDYIRNVTLSLSWDGGQETVQLVLDKLEYEG
jgi:hypothetical protein